MPHESQLDGDPHDLPTDTASTEDSPEARARQRRRHILGGTEFFKEGEHITLESFGQEARGTALEGANARQVGGSHYGLNNLQHWDLVVLFGWDYFQSQIIKYVMRHKKKNRVQDLKKAAHFLEKYIEVLEQEERRGNKGTPLRSG